MEKERPTVFVMGEQNILSIIKKTSKALRKAGFTNTKIQQYQSEAAVGTILNTIKVTHRWARVR